MLLFFIVARFSLNVEKPGTAQNVAEVVHEFVSDQADSIIGHGFEPFVPYATMILMFVLSCNLIGLLPGMETPTANPAVPLGIAIPTFLLLQLAGLARQRSHRLHQDISRADVGDILADWSD